MKVYFGGADQPALRKKLLDAGVTNLSISFAGLRSRLPKTKPWLVSEHFPEGVSLALESGGFKANKTQGVDHEEHLEAYISFVEANHKALNLITEYDPLEMGEDWIRRWRADYWDSYPLDKFCPVWHEEYGVPALDRLADEYSHIGVIATKMNYSTKYNGIAARRAAAIHGFSMANPDYLIGVRFDSITTTSWVSPIKYGETMVWTGNVMRRYQAKDKERARKRHAMDFERAGFDPEAIQADDDTELLRYTVWAWLQFEAEMSRRKPEAVLSVVQDVEIAATSPSEPLEAAEEAHLGTVVIPGPAPGSRLPAVREQKMTLPGVAVNFTTSRNDEGEAVEVPILTLTHQTLRQCDSCYVNARCPKFAAGSECAYESPIQVRTREQLLATHAAMIEMQMERILFMRMNEELEGGYPDPNLSNELDRLTRMQLTIKEIQDSRDYMELSIRAKAGAGMMSRIFGEAVARPLHDLPGPMASDDVMDALLEDDDA